MNEKHFMVIETANSDLLNKLESMMKESGIYETIPEEDFKVSHYVREYCLFGEKRHELIVLRCFQNLKQSTLIDICLMCKELDDMFHSMKVYIDMDGLQRWMDK